MVMSAGLSLSASLRHDDAMGYSGRTRPRGEPMAGTFLQRRATADRGVGVVVLRGHDLSPPTDDLRLMDLSVEVLADGGSVELHVLGELGWVLAASAVTDGDQVVIDEHGVALRATWTGGTTGTLQVYASPKVNGAL